LLLSSTTAHVTDNHQPRMDTDTDGELETFGLLQILLEVLHGMEDTQARAYCSLGVIFMGVGVTKIDEQTVTEQLGDMPIVALDDFGTNPLILVYHIPILLWV
jgi:hypothetical protein